MSRILNRAYRLQVDSIEASGELNIAFDVERTLARRPGRTTVKVWNLNPDHRAQLGQLRRGVFVELHAGYEDSLSLIFRGELGNVRSERDGAGNVITTVRSRDGHAAHAARVSSSHRPGAPFGAVVQSVVGSMGVGVGNLPQALAGASMGGVATFVHGATVSGSATDELDRLLSSAGLEWSIQEGSLQVLRRGAALARAAVLISASTGMVASPSRDDHGKVVVRCKLVPDIVPAALVRIESADINGTFRIEHAHYKAEYDSAEWGAELVCDEPTQRAA